MLLLLIFVLSLLATLSYTYLLPLRHPKNEPFNPPPGPKKLLFIGNLHQLDFTSPHICLAKLAKTYGPILSLQFGSIPVVVVQSAELAKVVLQTQDLNFCTRPAMFGARKLSYDGLDIAISPYNDYFREMKKLSVVHLLNTKRVQSFALIRQQEILRLLNKISSLSTASKIVNLNELVMNFSCSNICRMAFGKRYEFHYIVRFLGTCFQLLKLVVIRIQIQVQNIFVAGTDTSAATIVWGMTQLIKNPDVMKKVQQEIRNATGHKDYVGEEQVRKLEYFKTVVKEIFRLHPASPLMVAHESIRKTKIKGYDILPKTLVYVNVWTIGRDPASWNDPETFKPERFIGSSIDVKGQDYELLPF